MRRTRRAKRNETVYADTKSFRTGGSWARSLCRCHRKLRGYQWRARVEADLGGGDRASCEDAGGRARVGPCDPGRSGGRPPIPNHLLPRRASPVGTRPVAPCQAAFAERSAGSQVQYRSTYSANRSPRLSNLLADQCPTAHGRSEEHTSELQSLMRISYA